MNREVKPVMHPGEDEAPLRSSLIEVYDYLKRFSLSDSLFIIGSINAAFRYGFKTLSTQSIPPETLRWIEVKFPDRIDRLNLMLNVTRIARFLLLSRANEYKDLILDTGSKELVNALNLVSNLYDERVEPPIKSKGDLDRVMSRMSQWQLPLQELKGDLSARAHLLFRKIPKEIGSTYDIDAGMRRAVGLSAFEFMAIGHTLGAMCSGVLKHDMTIEVDSLKEIVTKEKVQKFIEISSGTPEDYRRYVRDENWKESDPLRDIYGLDPLVRMPLIKTTNGKYIEKSCWVVPQVNYLWQRMSSGIFHILADYERTQAQLAGNNGQNLFRDAFGDIYKHYVGLQLNQGKKNETLIDLDTLNHQNPKPDFALISGNQIILFEVKVGFLTAASKYLGDEKQIRAELKRENGQFAKAVRQLNSFADDLMAGTVTDPRLAGKTEILKVIVGYEDFYLANSYLLPIAEEEFGTTAIENLQIMTLMDLDLCGTALANEGRVIEPMFKKVADKNLKLWSVAMYIKDQNKTVRNKNPLLNDAFKEFFVEFSGKDPNAKDWDDLLGEE